MLSSLRTHLTYANVIATLALCIALGGTGFAASQLSGTQIEKRTIPGNRVKKNTLGGKEIKESKLKQVPRAESAGNAANADLLDGLDSTVFKVRCPSDTIFYEGACIELERRPLQSFGAAATTCTNLGRRLPDPGELMGFRLLPGIVLGLGEWTAATSVDTNGMTTTGHATVVDDETGADPPFPRPQGNGSPFRCVATPTG